MARLLSVGELIKSRKEQGKPPLADIELTEPVDRAIEIMIEHDFSQLPVRKEGRIIGVISFSSIIKTLFIIGGGKGQKEQIDLSKCRVEEFVDKTSVKNYSEDLFDLLETLARQSFILIETEDRKCEIITYSDVLSYFRGYSEAFLMLNDVENLLRQVISAKFNKATFRAKAKIVFKKRKKVPKNVYELYFRDYIKFLSFYWKEFGEVFGNKSIFYSCLNKVNKIRNSICHFRPISTTEKEIIQQVLNWLELKADCYLSMDKMPAYTLPPACIKASSKTK